MAQVERSDFSVQARFGEVIGTAAWGILPYALYDHQKELGLTVGEVWFCTYVLVHKWGKDWPQLSMTKLSNVSGVSPPTIREWIEALEDKGYLKRLSMGFGSRVPKVFDLSGLLSALEEAILRAAKIGLLRVLRTEVFAEDDVFAMEQGELNLSEPPLTN